MMNSNEGKNRGKIKTGVEQIKQIRKTKQI